jgi:alanine dehydrogenase
MVGSEMNIGVLSELDATEHRVALTPSGASALIRDGHRVTIHSGAGDDARFSDEQYEGVGARLVEGREEVFGRSELLLKVSSLKPQEVTLLAEGQAVLAFHHLAAADRALVDGVLSRGVTLIGYEVIEDPQEDLPILHAMSEIAGQMAVHVAGRYLETRAGGRGILLGGATGIPPAHVVILGAGVVGLWAARIAVGNRAQVFVMDSSVQALRHAEETFGRNVITEVAQPHSIARAASFADVLIGAVLNRGDKSPLVVSREMVEGMKPGSVIIDVSIDQGGCVETSRPTSLEEPTFIEEGITHFAVPNMTSAVARTASVALAHAALPYIQALADDGIETALRNNPGIAAGAYSYRGNLVSPTVGRVFGMVYENLGDAVGSPDYPGNIYA